MSRRLLFLLLCLGTPLTAQGISVGHWAVVRGEWTPEGFEASRVELTEPERYELLIGSVQADPRGGDWFRLLGQPVNVSDRTEWKGDLDPGELASLTGKRVKLEGRWRGPRKLSAREISSRGPGRDRIAGRVDELERVAGGLSLRIMHLRVFVPNGVEIEHELPLDRIPLTEQRVVWVAEEDLEDFDDLFGEGFELLPGLRLEGQTELRSTTEENFNLDDTDFEDRLDVSTSLRLRLAWQMSEDVDAVTELRYGLRWRDDQDDGRSKNRDAGLGETFLRVDDAFGISDLELVVGRQDFDDAREWIYDQNLDAVRMRWHPAGLEAELSASTTLTEGSDRDEAATNWIGYVSNGERKRHLAAWAVYRDVDRPGALREENLHLGGRAIGNWIPDTRLWFEAAHLRGERAGVPLRAWGYDLGATWTPFDEPWLSFTGGYAFGSGDRSPAGSGGHDRGFRQTGLQDNNGRFAGVTSFRYYGELMDPELSNLGILTLGVGTRLWDHTSLDLVWHDYLQDKALADLTDTDLDLRPDGLDADLGRELDLIFGWRALEGWDFEAVGAMFDPGAAFPGADRAYLLKLQLRYRF